MQLVEAQNAFAQRNVAVQEWQVGIHAVDESVIDALGDGVAGQSRRACGVVFVRARKEVMCLDVADQGAGKSVLETIISTVHGVKCTFADVTVGAINELAVNPVGKLHPVAVFVLNHAEFHVGVVEHTESIGAGIQGVTSGGDQGLFIGG